MSKKGKIREKLTSHNHHEKHLIQYRQPRRCFELETQKVRMIIQLRHKISKTAFLGHVQPLNDLDFIELSFFQGQIHFRK